MLCSVASWHLHLALIYTWESWINLFRAWKPVQGKWCAGTDIPPVRKYVYLWKQQQQDAGLLNTRSGLNLIRSVGLSCLLHTNWLWMSRNGERGQGGEEKGLFGTISAGDGRDWTLDLLHLVHNCRLKLAMALNSLRQRSFTSCSTLEPFCWRCLELNWRPPSWETHVLPLSPKWAKGAWWEIMNSV